MIIFYPNINLNAIDFPIFLPKSGSIDVEMRPTPCINMLFKR